MDEALESDSETETETETDSESESESGSWESESDDGHTTTRDRTRREAEDDSATGLRSSMRDDERSLFEKAMAGQRPKRARRRPVSFYEEFSEDFRREYLKDEDPKQIERLQRALRRDVRNKEVNMDLSDSDDAGTATAAARYAQGDASTDTDDDFGSSSSEYTDGTGSSSDEEDDLPEPERVYVNDRGDLLVSESESDDDSSDGGDEPRDPRIISRGNATNAFD